MRWVRPALTVVCHSAALVSSVDARWTSAGTRSVATATVAARWIDVGNTSLDDCEALTWSLGWTFAPSLDSARVARTSLAFMFDEVPEPVWNTSIGNWSSWRPSATSAAAAAIASATARSSTPRSAFTIAAAALIWASARMCWRSRRVPEIGKLSTARWVWARHSASFGTWTSPIVSRSMRYSMAPILPRAAAAWAAFAFLSTLCCRVLRAGEAMTTAGQTLDEVRRLRERARSVAHGGAWFPVAVLAALVLLSIALYRHPFRQVNESSGTSGWETWLLSGGQASGLGAEVGLLGLNRPGPILIVATLPMLAFAVVRRPRSRGGAR